MLAYQLLVAATLALPALSQTFRRTAACPELGCLFPPSQTDFIAGRESCCWLASDWLTWPVETFDIRVEVQAPVNGSEAYNGGIPSPDFTLTIGGEGAAQVDVLQFFGIADPKGTSCLPKLDTLLTLCSRFVQLYLVRGPLCSARFASHSRQRSRQDVSQLATPHPGKVRPHLYLQQWDDDQGRLGGHAPCRL
jgi:hypothetical protein